MTLPTNPLVSVVIIGRNEDARLESCLRSVARIERDGFTTETIYADSGSTDASLQLATALGAVTLTLESDRPTAALGRNAGWQHSHGDYVMFLDGDTVLAPSFVKAALHAMDDPAVAVVWGHRRETDPRGSIYNRVLDLDWIYPAGKAAFCGGDALFRRSLLEATGGFDGTLIAGEEPELCRRILALGGVILHIDQPMTGHDLAITRFNQYWKRAKRAGHAFAEVSTRFAATEDPFWTQDVRRNRNRALMLLALPVLALIAAWASMRWWPLGVLPLVLIGLVLRTAWKARWKSTNAVTLLLYGIHSHLQQIPIFVGQIGFHLDRRSGRKARLVEYKRP